jgi:penicillin amidase
MPSRRLLCALLFAAALPCAWAGAPPPLSVPGLSAPAELTRDSDGISHVVANSEADAWFVQGWLHARDRLFQMDEFRRTASGTLAELLGSAALASDVQLRTIGLRRAAVRSLAALSSEARASLEAYSRGVNAYVGSHALPPEYAALQISRFEPWRALDSVTIGKLFSAQLSLEFDIDTTVALQTYLQAGAVAGFDGQALFFEDLHRAQPFDPASTVPDAMQTGPAPGGGHPDARLAPDPRATALGKRWRDSIEHIPALAPMLHPHQRPGSNLWAVSADLSATGRPLIANDRHLQLTTPPVWYPIGLQVPGRLEVFGVSFAGTPAVLGGYNRHLAWGSTNTLFDVTDTYQEQVVPDPASPSGPRG